MELLKILFVYPWCDHEYRHLRTVHGDERNMGYCSEWRCRKCGNAKFSNRMHILDEPEKGHWWVK